MVGLRQALRQVRLPAVRLPAMRVPAVRAPAIRLRGGWGRPALVLGLTAALLLAGGATAAARVAGTSGRILAGVTIDGVDVGGMTRGEAIAAVQRHARPILDRTITVRAAGKTWRVTPAQLGLRAQVEEAVDRALQGPELNALRGLYHRALGRPVDMPVALAWEGDPARVDAFLKRVALSVALAPQDAVLRLSADYTQLIKRASRAGRALDVQGARARLTAAITDGASEVTLPVRVLEPKVTEEHLGRTIVVNRSANTLDLYQGLKVIRHYRVATGMPGYRTPLGNWQITLKRRNPTWVNPDPEGWGKDMPPVIGPGPDNPLGTRALNLNAPGIRIHGTYASWSIGTYASHGCIRMRIADVEELFELVPVGARVLIHGAGPSGPMLGPAG